MATADDLTLALSSHDPRRVPLERKMAQAAVAAIFRESDERGLELLLIRRAEHPDDPWSGHMAFPGGRVDPTDADPLAAAIRETSEEVDVDLPRSARHVGELSHVLAKSHGQPLPMVIVPHVFLLTEPVTPTPEPGEVAEVLFVPFDHLVDRNNRTKLERRYAGVPMTFDCYRLGDGVLWGLTLQMVDELLGMVA